MLFNNVAFNPIKVLTLATSAHLEYQKAFAPLQEDSTQQEPSNYHPPDEDPPGSFWSPPCHGTIKINCDASFFGPSAGTAAFVLRNSFGDLISGGTSSFCCLNALQAEAMALLKAVADPRAWY